MPQNKYDQFYREARRLFNDGYHKECVEMLRSLYNHPEASRIHLIKTCILLAGVTDNKSLAKLWLATAEAKLGEELEEVKSKGNHKNLGIVLDKLVEAVNDMSLEMILENCGGDISEDVDAPDPIPVPKPREDTEGGELQKDRESAKEAEKWDIERAVQRGEIEIKLVPLDLPFRSRQPDRLADSVKALWEMDIGDLAGLRKS